MVHVRSESDGWLLHTVTVKRLRPHAHAKRLVLCFPFGALGLQRDEPVKGKGKNNQKSQANAKEGATVRAGGGTLPLINQPTWVVTNMV
jgi:hypothetical protein